MLMDSLFQRRSIRKFIDEEIDETRVRYMLKAGMAAPSARNEQPWHFIVIDNKSILKKVTSFHPYSQMLNHSPLAILVCGDINKIPGDRDEKIKIGYLLQDCSAATQNILLAATSQELGSVWLGIYPVSDRVEGVRKLVKLPANIIPISLIAIGKPAEEKTPNDRYLAERVHFNKFGSSLY